MGDAPGELPGAAKDGIALPIVAALQRADQAH